VFGEYLIIRNVVQ